ncbi:hypothetical protein E8E13_005298 [Curvularia kusanoi]|uniref:Zn(2)-C6 fungal-type domain-containing protein n=1 Tax=Curvularia kusanoi TaxID=90978 RepID=A0A9P4WA35_CURKU|nr:hypothetical protein E8E13_005298 [Curvularia kusanoi]
MSQQDLNVVSGRNRSFGGCSTCRSRHLKCDEGRPECSPCKSSGLQCGGYEKRIFFDFEVASDANLPRFRRPLLSEEERESMSESLTKAVSPKTVSRHLNEIDEECDTVLSSANIAISVGPFGAFRIVQNSTTAITDASDGSIWADCTQNVGLESDMTVTATSGSLTPRTRVLFQSLLELPGEEFDPSTFTLDGTIDGTICVNENFDESDVNLDFHALRQKSALPEIRHDFLFNNTDVNHGLIPPSPASMRLSVGADTIPHDAVHLIKHYSTTVLTLLTPFRHSKTPWHVLFVPHAKSCLAALTLGETLDHASLCAFYATLSVSASSLNGITQLNMWRDQARRYLGTAREHVRSMLKTAYDYPKTAKYKHILIALLSMVQVAIVVGNRDQAECYFIEAEKFIRMKGLNRKKSRKVRLLHHCYVYERLLHESIYIAGTNSSHRSHTRKAIESSGAMVYSQDSFSFCLGNLENLEGQTLHVKCREEGENDLHLQIPGFWPDTLYPEIFGLPEKYLFALSLVIRLGQWKDEARIGDTAATLSLKDFLNRAKTVEHYIKTLHRETHGPVAPPVVQLQATEPVLEDLLQAMCHALAIYFYRRIYNVDSDMLQKHVMGVRDCLLRLDSTDSTISNGSARLLWPALIAACEAEDRAMQTSFIQWFKNSASCSGLPYFDIAKSTIERVWQARRDGLTTTWMDLMIDANFTGNE